MFEKIKLVWKVRTLLKEWRMAEEAGEMPEKKTSTALHSIAITGGGVALTAFLSWLADPVTLEAVLAAAGFKGAFAAALLTLITAGTRLAQSYLNKRDKTVIVMPITTPETGSAVSVKTTVSAPADVPK